MGDFYGIGIEMWAGFGLVGITEKRKIWANYEQLFMLVFSCFNWQRKNKSNNQKHCKNEVLIKISQKSKKKNQLCLVLLEIPHRGTFL